MKRRRVALSLLLAVFAGCSTATGDAAPDGRSHDGPAVALGFGVIETRPAGGFAARFTLTNQGSETLESAGWALYFSFNRPVDDESVTGGVRFEHLNGDFWRMIPTAGFTPLRPGETRVLRFDGRGWLLKESGAPAGPYFVFASPEGERVVEPSGYELEPWPVWKGAGTDVPAAAPTAVTRFEAERATAWVDLAELPPIVPTPVSSRRAEGRVVLDGSWRIAAGVGLETQGRYLARKLGELVGSDIAVVSGGAPGAGVVLLALGPVEAPGRTTGETGEVYRLTVDPERGVRIVGGDPPGVFYGIQSLLALAPIEAWNGGAPGLSIPAIEIVDAPRFAYRGLHLDVARNFQPRPAVEKLLDAMAFYKLNRFHFHLSDDEGWRLAIAGLPELAEVGARRGHTLDDGEHLVPSFGSGPHPDAAGNHGSGHYSRADFVALLRHAAERHIEVIPEVDVPGHARAAIKAMEARTARLAADGRGAAADAMRLVDPADTSRYRSVQGWDDNVIDVCLESTYAFLDAVFTDLVAMYGEAGAPLTAIHIGGDEVPAGVWEGSPACKRLIATDAELASTADLAEYFLRRVSAMLARRGLATAGWEEIALRGDVHGAGAGKEPNPEFLDRRFRPYVWNNVWGWGAEDLGYRLANAGYEVVLANATHLYFDLAYDRDPREPGYTWAGTVDTKTTFRFTPLDVFRAADEDRLGHPLDGEKLYAGRMRLTPAGRARVLGIQGQVWGENARGSAAMEYLAFPKLIALAERAWAAQPVWAREPVFRERTRRREEDWSRFANALGRRELPRLDAMGGGFTYRLPPPGAVIIDGKLHANVRYPGLEIRYALAGDGGAPHAGSRLYEEPVAVDGPILLRSFDRRGRGSLVSRVEP